jgi:beta-glucosidase
MIMNRTWTAPVLTAAMWALVVLGVGAASDEGPLYQNTNAPVEKRVEDLLGRLTLEQKLDLLGGTGFATKPIARLGVPALQMADAPHGVRYGKATTFPPGVGMAATWDVDLIERVGVALGRELSGKGVDVLLGPCVNIHRSPRGGRNVESFSEDPYLAARMTAAYIKGVQSQGVAACAKHFACNNQETNRLSIDVQVDERALREIYLPAFKAAVQEAGVWTIMSAYNRVNGPFASANPHLLTDILRKDWGFTGLAMSDWGAVHGSVDTTNAGLDLEMPKGAHLNVDQLAGPVRSGEVSESVIDDKIRRLIRTLIRCGLLDGPKCRNPEAVNCPEHQRLAREVAAKAIVLLKNEGGILPLDPGTIRSVAVIGPCANVSLVGGRGSAAVVPFYHVTALEGLRNRWPDTVALNYAEGDVPGPADALRPIDPGALSPPDAEPGQHGLRGEYFAGMDLSGEPLMTRVDRTIDFDWDQGAPDPKVPADGFSVRWTGRLTAPMTGEYGLGFGSDDGARLYLDGDLIVDNWTDHAYEAKTATVTLQEGRSYDIKMEYYENWGAAVARLGWVIPRSAESMMEEAARAAADSDVAIVFAGISVDYEGEGLDRKDLDLPGNQDELIRRVAAANKKTIVVLTSGTPIMMGKWIDQVPAVLQAWYSGQEGGNAIADVLFGDVNPSGKLPVTFARRREDYPDVPNFPGADGVVKYAEGIFVGYRHFDRDGIQPLFPFGHGLSYTTFEYGDLKVAPQSIHAGEKVNVSITVANTGKRAGDEVVQLYVRDPESSVPRPVRELKAFQKVQLKPGEQRTVTFNLGTDALSFYDVDAKGWRAEPRRFEVEVGSSSRDIRARGAFELLP